MTPRPVPERNVFAILAFCSDCSFASLPLSLQACLHCVLELAHGLPSGAFGSPMLLSALFLYPLWSVIAARTIQLVRFVGFSVRHLSPPHRHTPTHRSSSTPSPPHDSSPGHDLLRVVLRAREESRSFPISLAPKGTDWVAGLETISLALVGNERGDVM